MTREEAKEFIAQSVKSDVDMALVADAIKALEQEPTTKNGLGVDLIAKPDAINAVSEALKHTFVEHEDIANKIIGKLPTITPQEHLISRADAIKAIQGKAKELKNEDTINGLCGAVAILFDMPSVTTKNDLEVKKETITYLDGFADGLNMAHNSTNKMLDKIRAEIESYKLSEDELSGMDEDSIKWGMKIAYDIVGKYKADKEDKE